MNRSKSFLLDIVTIEEVKMHSNTRTKITITTQSSCLEKMRRKKNWHLEGGLRICQMHNKKQTEKGMYFQGISIIFRGNLEIWGDI